MIGKNWLSTVFPNQSVNLLTSQLIKVMYTSFQLAIKYIHYYISASNGRGHGIHSPFVFDFIEKILNDHRHFYVYDRVEALRQRMLNDTRILEVEDYGAGSSKTASNKRSVLRLQKML